MIRTTDLEEKIIKAKKIVEKLNLAEPYKSITYRALLDKFLYEEDKESVAKPVVQKKLKFRGKKTSTVENILNLKEEGFFSSPKSLREIIEKFKSKDYHYHPADLTDPLRRIIRSGQLKKTKDLPKGGKSKNWMYMNEK